MLYATKQGNTVSGEPIPAARAESQFDVIAHPELIDIFYETEGDAEVGRELSVRIFEHAGFPADPTTTPLIGRDGKPVQQDGKGLTLADYVNFAAQHHFEAVESILDFLMMEKQSPNYETMRATILARLNITRV